jgi:hypothetical protein
VLEPATSASTATAIAASRLPVIVKA